MNENLKFLIERARGYQMTADEREEQVRSFAYGNTHLENSSITMSDVESALHEMSEPASPDVPRDPVQL